MPPRGELPRIFRPLTDRQAQHGATRVVEGGSRRARRRPRGAGGPVPPRAPGAPAGSRAAARERTDRRLPGGVVHGPGLARHDRRARRERRRPRRAVGARCRVARPTPPSSPGISPSGSTSSRSAATWRASRSTSRSPTGVRTCAAHCTSCSSTPTPRRPRCTASWRAAPEHLRRLGREAYQLLVTTSYDDALERAFDEAHEPYDLVVFVGARGPHRGRFVHVPLRRRPAGVPPDPRPERVRRPPDRRSPASSTRTIIVKLHGGTADLGREWRTVRDNFVITEDDYIGYLTEGPVEGLIPVQILDKVRESHFLFLGYRMQDWTRRVFLQRDLGRPARGHPVHGGRPRPGSRRARALAGLRRARRRAARRRSSWTSWTDKLALLAVAPAER